MNVKPRKSSAAPLFLGESAQTPFAVTTRQCQCNWRISGSTEKRNNLLRRTRESRPGKSHVPINHHSGTSFGSLGVFL
jgi:hypothetical protein